MPQSGVRRRRGGRRSELAEYGDELSMDKRSPITDRLDWVRFSKSVETCEQAYALTTGKFGFGRAPAFEIRHKSQSRSIIQIPLLWHAQVATHYHLSIKHLRGEHLKISGVAVAPLVTRLLVLLSAAPALLAAALSATLKKNFP